MVCLGVLSYRQEALHSFRTQIFALGQSLLNRRATIVLASDVASGSADPDYYFLLNIVEVREGV